MYSFPTSVLTLWDQNLIITELSAFTYKLLHFDTLDLCSTNEFQKKQKRPQTLEKYLPKHL